MSSSSVDAPQVSTTAHTRRAIPSDPSEPSTSTSAPSTPVTPRYATPVPPKKPLKGILKRPPPPPRSFFNLQLSNINIPGPLSRFIPSGALNSPSQGQSPGFQNSPLPSAGFGGVGPRLAAAAIATDRLPLSLEFAALEPSCHLRGTYTCQSFGR